MQATAAVVREAGGPLSLEEVEVSAPRPTEVLVRLASVGICRTDLHAIGYMPVPIVLGHEGAGYVQAVGSEVKKVAEGDAVMMTFQSCGRCRTCRGGAMAYCEQFNALNFSGRRPDGTSALSSHGELIGAHFLGQSCFATHAVADERSVVRLPAESDLRPLGPFGCSFQTGAGAVLNALRPRPRSSFAVFGAGAVGLAAVAAASLAGCHPILAIDIDRHRLDVAGRLGATHVVHSGEGSVDELVAAVVPGGLDFAVDTTGLASVVRTAVGRLSTRGVCGIIGAGPSDDLVLDWRTVLNGRTVTGIIAGNSIPDLFLPELIQLYQEGKFPIDEMLQYFPFAEVNQAVAASEGGEVIKAVLTF